jgi:hypothetical protein
LGYLLLANAGIPGLALFLLFVGSLYLPALRFRQGSACDLYEQSIFGATVMLAGLFVAGSEPVQPILWALFGVATLIFLPQHSYAMRSSAAQAFNRRGYGFARAGGVLGPSFRAPSATAR